MSYRGDRAAYVLLDEIEKFAIPSKVKTGLKVGAGVGGAAAVGGGVTRMIQSRQRNKRQEQRYQDLLGHMAGKRMALLAAIEDKQRGGGFPDGDVEDFED